MPGDYDFTFHDPFEDSDDQIVERTVFTDLFNKEILPDDPPTPPETAIAAQRSSPARMHRYAFRVRDAAGDLVATAGSRIDPEHDDNPEVLWFGGGVLPKHRQNGLGTKLLAEMVAVAQAEARTRLMFVTQDVVPGGAAFATSLGAKKTMSEHTNHLPVEAVDRALLERWVAEAPNRAADYELFAFDGPCPEEWIQRYINVILVMNTAPREDMEINDFTLTPEEIREHDDVRKATGDEAWTLVVRHIESGEWVGYHDMVWSPSDPTVMYVDSTGVRPEHRGHAIGKWLKAAMTLRILDERPGVVDIRTGNADSNDAMLGINKLMGYRPLIAHSAWEVSTAAATQWLAARGAAATLELPSR